MAWWQKLKNRWEIESDFAAIIIFVVFGITGTSSLYVADFIQGILDNNFSLSPGWGTTIRIVLVFIVYQFLLIMWGTLFGQFRFFWTQEKKILRLFGKLFTFFR
jgi:hypothetical protein